MIPLFYPIYYFSIPVKQRKRFKKSNQTKWQNALSQNQMKVLIVDDKLPYIESGSGYPRTRKIIDELIEMGCFVTY